MGDESTDHGPDIPPGPAGGSGTSNDPNVVRKRELAKLRMRRYRARKRAGIVQQMDTLYCDFCQQPYQPERYLSSRRKYCCRECKEQDAARLRRHRLREQKQQRQGQQ